MCMHVSEFIQIYMYVYVHHVHALKPHKCNVENVQQIYTAATKKPMTQLKQLDTFMLLTVRIHFVEE